MAGLPSEYVLIVNGNRSATMGCLGDLITRGRLMINIRRHRISKLRKLLNLLGVRDEVSWQLEAMITFQFNRKRKVKN